MGIDMMFGELAVELLLSIGGKIDRKLGVFNG